LDKGGDDMKTISIILSMALLVCFSIMALGLTAPASAEKRPILIGHVHSVSGAMSMYGKSCTIAGEIAVEEINEAGGVLGRPLKQITRDDKLNPEVGLREAKSLVLDEKVDFLTGTISSAVCQAMSAYCRDIKKIFMVSIAQSSRTTEELGHRYIFRVDTNSYPYHGVPADFAAKKWGVKKLCVSGPDYEWGKVAARDFVEIYKRIVPDAKVVREVWVPLGTTDFTPYISAMLGSGAELLQHSFYGGQDLGFTKQAYMMGLFKKMHVSASCTGDTETWYKVRKGEPYAEGAVATCRYPYWAIKNPRNREFCRKFGERTEIVSNYGAMNQYIIVHTLADIIKEVGAVDTEKIIDALEGRWVKAPFDPPLDKIKIRACDHQAMFPTWVGIIGFGPDLPFPYITQITVAEDPETTYRSCAEIAKIRDKAKKEGLRPWEK
jgi:branched-chain amino acid transport system substrate-binding protein